jgi:hypothetical protein
MHQQTPLAPDEAAMMREALATDLSGAAACTQEMEQLIPLVASRVRDLREYALPLLPKMLVVTLLFVTTTLGIGLLSLVLGVCRWRTLGRAALLLAALLAIWGAGTYGGIGFWVPLKPGETWALEELGATAPLVPEYRQMLPFPPWAGWLTTGSGLALAAVLLANVPCRRWTAREQYLVWVLAGQGAHGHALAVL